MISLALCAIFGAVALALVFIARRRMPAGSVRALLIAFAALAVLTLIFDNLMIASGLFGYGEGTIVGLRIGFAPIEDFAYPFVSLLVVAAVMALLGPRRRDNQ